MKHVTEVAGTTAARLRALRDKAPLGLYNCAHCRDLGLIYVRTMHNPLSHGVLPCPMCGEGHRRHLDGNVCVWARGHRPCRLCGAHEGEQVPAGYMPKLPVGYVSLDELAALHNVKPSTEPDECPF